MSRKEIRICGFGGQGVIKMAQVIGEATAIHENKYSTLNQSFGPEARGGSCSATLVIDEKRVDYPYISNPELMIAMSQQAYEKYEPEVLETGTIIIEEELVEPGKTRGTQKIYAIPATRFAEEIGHKIVLNIIMIGFFAAITDIASVDSLRESVKTNVPSGTIELNMQAFEKGYDFGKAIVGS